MASKQVRNAVMRVLVWQNEGDKTPVVGFYPNEDSAKDQMEMLAVFSIPFAEYVLFIDSGEKHPQLTVVAGEAGYDYGIPKRKKR